MGQGGYLSPQPYWGLNITSQDSIKYEILPKWILILLTRPGFWSIAVSSWPWCRSACHIPHTSPLPSSCRCPYQAWSPVGKRKEKDKTRCEINAFLAEIFLDSESIFINKNPCSINGPLGMKGRTYFNISWYMSPSIQWQPCSREMRKRC